MWLKILLMNRKTGNTFYFTGILTTLSIVWHRNIKHYYHKQITTNTKPIKYQQSKARNIDIVFTLRHV